MSTLAKVTQVLFALSALSFCGAGMIRLLLRQTEDAYPLLIIGILALIAAYTMGCM